MTAPDDGASDGSAVVIGASGGIGGALVAVLRHVEATSPPVQPLAATQSLAVVAVAEVGALSAVTVVVVEAVAVAVVIVAARAKVMIARRANMVGN